MRARTLGGSGNGIGAGTASISTGCWRHRFFGGRETLRRDTLSCDRRVADSMAAGSIMRV